MNCSLDYALKMDREDPLREFRKRFCFSDEKMIYLDGNSLGRLPLASLTEMEKQTGYFWGERLIRSWNENWYGKAAETAKLLSKILGADEEEVIFADSTSVNLFKLAWSALKFKQDRRKIVSEGMNFPTDLYILQGLGKVFQEEHEIVLFGSPGDPEPDLDELISHLDADTALLTLSHVNFRSSYLYPMKEVNDAAHAAGALTLWDLSHSVGSVPVDLRSSGTDLAVGCSYKYLNGGPGAPAFIYVRKELQEKLFSPVTGWFGDSDPFRFNIAYREAKGIRKFITGTPPVLSLSMVKPGIEIVLEAGMERLRDKSIKQSNYLCQLVREWLKDSGASLASPQDPANRGSHIALRHPEAYRICKALIDEENGNFIVIPDFRDPDIIRLGITPLYTSFEDIFIAISELRRVITEGSYLNYPDSREDVT